MSQINPFTWIVQGTQAQQRPSIAKERQIRRAQNLAKNAALAGDHLEHQVESSDTVHAADDHDPNMPERRPRKGRGTADQEPPPLDLRA